MIKLVLRINNYHNNIQIDPHPTTTPAHHVHHLLDGLGSPFLL